MQHFVPEIVSIADACLGGLRGRSALLIGSEIQRQPYKMLLQQAGIKSIYQEETPQRLTSLLPYTQLLMNMPDLSRQGDAVPNLQISAAAIAQGCAGRRTPLVIFDLAETSSIEELAGLLPAVCLYTPDDLRSILARKLFRMTLV